jgi:hypothetical protein
MFNKFISISTCLESWSKLLVQFWCQIWALIKFQIQFFDTFIEGHGKPCSLQQIVTQHPPVHHLNRKFVINMTQLWINGKQVTNFCLPSIWTMAIRNAFCVHLVSWMSFPMVIYSLYILHCKCRLELFHTQNLYSCHVLLLLSPHQTWMKYHTPWWGSANNSQIRIKYFWGI